MKAKDLKPHERNPRKITAERQDGLRKSVEEFGDLGGIIFNQRDKKLRGGHQRISVLNPEAEIKIVKKYAKPTAAGTVGEGYLESGGERFSVRIVDWDAKKAAAAMIAANQHRGEWDTEMLALEIKEHGLFEDEGAAAILGFDDDEISSLLESPGQPFDDDHFSEEVGADTKRESAREEVAERAAVMQAAEAAREAARPEPTAEEAHSAFEQVEERTEIVGKQQVIILNFERQDMKEAFKHQIRTDGTLEKFGCKIF